VLFAAWNDDVLNATTLTLLRLADIPSSGRAVKWFRRIPRKLLLNDISSGNAQANLKHWNVPAFLQAAKPAGSKSV
jgi:hypothetical protein